MSEKDQPLLANKINGRSTACGLSNNSETTHLCKTDTVVSAVSCYFYQSNNFYCQDTATSRPDILPKNAQVHIF